MSITQNSYYKEMKKFVKKKYLKEGNSTEIK